MAKELTILMLIFGIISCAGITANSGKVVQKNEIVMPPNSTIVATTSAGSIIIKSGRNLERSYTWEGATRSVIMWPREQRWHGSLGLYYPGPGYHWKEHNGISRCVVEEGWQNFDNIEDALFWLKHRYHPTVYRNDGLVVAYGKILPRKQLSVEVWQIYIKGQKPKILDGSNDQAIKKSF